MRRNIFSRNKILIFLLFLITCGCDSNSEYREINSLIATTVKITETQHINSQEDFLNALACYAFPKEIDPSEKFLFYFHGKIVEDQDFPIISPEYGEYQYLPILETLSKHGFHVISEKRPPNTDSYQYAEYISKQVNQLLKAGVPPQNIIIVGASKGGGIAILLSNIMENHDINFVFMAICDPATVQQIIDDDVKVYGRILSLYDESDAYGGTCADLFAFSSTTQHLETEEIILNINKGHGMLYAPLDEWILPIVEWAHETEK